VRTNRAPGTALCPGSLLRQQRFPLAKNMWRNLILVPAQALRMVCRTFTWTHRANS